MNLAPKKLTAAHALLLDLLSHGRSMMVASCIAAATVAGLSMRTLFEAQKRMEIECDRAGDGPGSLRLVGVTSPPLEWKPRKLHRCIVCGEPVNHWRRRRCPGDCGGRRPSF